MARRLLLGVSLAACVIGPAALAGADGGAAGPAPLELTRLSLDARGIRTVMDHHLPSLRACYERALVDGGRAGGKVMAQFTVGPRGTVTEASVEELGEGIRRPDVCRCLEQALTKMEFPRPADGEAQPVATPLILTAVE
ncbi:MAG: hypothetical protein RL653_2565 [Pseudomonadota bacterium]